MSAPFSKKAIADIGLFGDKMTQRTSTDRQLAIIDNQLDGSLREALKGLKILHDEEAKRQLREAIIGIHKAWEDMRGSAIQTGRLLLQIYRMGPDIYEALFKKEKAIFPFGRSVEVKLRRIAEDIERGRFIESNLPIAYSAAYELTTLTDEQLDMARQRGLVRPETIRKEIIAFKREIGAKNKGVPYTDHGITALKSRRTYLERKRKRMLAALKKIDADLAEINRLLNSPYEEAEFEEIGSEVSSEGTAA